jgi:hypothetical protein
MESQLTHTLSHTESKLGDFDEVQDKVLLPQPVAALNTVSDCRNSLELEPTEGWRNAHPAVNRRQTGSDNRICAKRFGVRVT